MKDGRTHYDVVVIGGGWAGIGVSYALKEAGLNHIVFERSRICETWRTQRWSAFRMNTPNVLTVMPGDSYQGDDPEGFMTCQEFVDMVEGFARRHSLPVRTRTAVQSVERQNGGFVVASDEGTITADNVVAATGNLNVPRRPDGAAGLSPEINQMDGSDYHDTRALAEGAVLVVGCGNSGGQIAEDIALAGRKVFLSTSRNGRVPRRYRGKDVILWLVENGQMAQPRPHDGGRPLLGATHTISLQSLSALGITLLGRFESVLPDGTLTFTDSLAESLEYGNENAQRVRDVIDAYIAENGIDAPPGAPDAAETLAPELPDPPILRLDPQAEGISTVIWSTGFIGDFSWLKVPGALNNRGQPIETGCVSVPGVYFAGLDSSASLAAGTIHVVEQEAYKIVDHIVSKKAGEAHLQVT